MVWHIVWMELWGKEYFNMMGQAYIRIEDDGCGELRFGLASAGLEGRVVNHLEVRFEFTFEGYDECDPVHGFGWIGKLDEDTVEGEIVFHGGDKSRFQAKRTKDL